MSLNNVTLFSATFTKTFAFNGHPVTVECERGHGSDEPNPLTLQCPECGLPFVVAQVILMMATHNIRKCTADGAELVRVA